MLHYFTTLGDTCIIYLIHMQRERTLLNESTACHGLDLALDLNQKGFRTSVNVFFFYIATFAFFIFYIFYIAFILLQVILCLLHHTYLEKELLMLLILIKIHQASTNI